MLLCREEVIIRLLDTDWIREPARHMVGRLLLGVAMVMSVAVTAQAVTPAGTHRAVMDLATPVATSVWSARQIRSAPRVTVNLLTLYPLYRWITRRARV